MAAAKMDVTGHLADLRKRIIYVVVVFFLVLCCSLGFISKIYSYVTAPMTSAHQKLVVISPGEVVTVYLSMAGMVAVGLTLPYALYQLWRFVEPGLTAVERKITLRLLPLMLVMFLVGVSFAWFIVFPTILHFLIRLSLTHFQVYFRAESYFSFLTSICLPFGFVFELPIVVTFLTRLGMLTPHRLGKARRYAYVVIVVLGVLISPPELISHLSVVLPMFVLYEVSIVLSKVAQKARAKALARLEHSAV